MLSKFNRPKGFGEILDHTFSLSKDRFKDFFLILLIFMGPVYLIQAIIMMVSGTSFFRQAGTGGNWFEQMLTSFEGTAVQPATNFGADIAIIVASLLGLLLFPIAEAAILFTIQHIKDQEQYTIGSVIKQAFSRFWPLLGSNILFGLIALALIIVPIILIGVLAGVFTMMLSESFAGIILGILTGIVIFLAFAAIIGYFLTRWSFYFGAVVLEKNSPGLSRSWKLTKKRTWPLVGLYIIFYIITSMVTFAVEMTFGLGLGNSVLMSLITNFMTLITTLFFSVGYAVMFFDLKIRNDADDLKGLIEEYKSI